MPVLALLVFWSIGSIAAFSVAGEKMPWLTTHIALPLTLAAGWAVGYLIETAPWREMRTVRGWLVLPLLAVFVPALASLFYTVATAGGQSAADTLSRTQNVALISAANRLATIQGDRTANRKRV